VYPASSPKHPPPVENPALVPDFVQAWTGAYKKAKAKVCILNPFGGSQLVTSSRTISSVTGVRMNSRRGMEDIFARFMSHVFLCLVSLVRHVPSPNFRLAEVDAWSCRLKPGRLRKRLTSPLAWAG
jgi:hypothetical protein